MKDPARGHTQQVAELSFEPRKTDIVTVTTGAQARGAGASLWQTTTPEVPERVRSYLSAGMDHPHGENGFAWRPGHSQHKVQGLAQRAPLVATQ